MQRRLLWKLVGVQTVLVAVVLIVLGLLVQRLSLYQILTYVKEHTATENPTGKIYFDFMDRYFLGASILVGVLVLGISFVVTRRILLPLSHLAGMAHRISTGEYSARVQPSKRGEFAQITSAFNQMAESLQRTDELRKSLVSNVAHELRTPLTNIRGYLEALQDGVVPPSVETYRTLNDETLRVVNLVDDLIRLARAESAIAEMAVEEVDLDQLLGQVMKLFELQFSEKNISVQVSAQALKNPITADRRKLTQVLTNLLDNACRYTPAGGEISVRAERDSARVKLVFSNPCAPIGKQERELLFERFYRIEKSRSRQWGGAGIGLAIVKELVIAHGGSVGVDSRDSTISVWFTIPVHAGVPHITSKENEKINGPSGENRPPFAQPVFRGPQVESAELISHEESACIGDSAELRMILPVGRSVWAILAGYIGLFSVLVIPAPFAVWFGVLAIRDIRRDPTKHGMGRAIFGIICGLLVMGSVAVFLVVSALE